MMAVQIITAADAGNTINATIVPALRSFCGHDLRWWRDLANTVMVWSLVIAALAAAGVVVSTKLALDWSAEIEKYDGAVTDLRIAVANQTGVLAGEKAGHAQAGVDAANVEIAKQKTLTAQARLEAQRIKREVSWRELSPEQFRGLVSALSGAPITVIVNHATGDQEAGRLANQLLDAFNRAGLLAHDSGNLSLTSQTLPPGIIVEGNAEGVRRMVAALSPSLPDVTPGPLGGNVVIVNVNPKRAPSFDSR